MKTLYSIIMILFLFSFSMAIEKNYATPINWYSFKEGKERAMIEKKPMLVDFAVAEGCPRCEAMQKNIYSKREIAEKINRDFIPVLIDLTKELTEDEKRLGEEYDFKSDCLLLFLDHEGRVIKDPSGKRLCFIDAVEPSVFIKYLDMIKSAREK